MSTLRGVLHATAGLTSMQFDSHVHASRRHSNLRQGPRQTRRSIPVAGHTRCHSRVIRFNSSRVDLATVSSSRHGTYTPKRTHNVKHAHLGARNRVHDRLHHLVSKHRMAWAAASDSWYDMQQHHHPTPHPIPSTTTQHHRQQQPARWCPAASIRAWGMKSSYLRCSRTPGA